MNIHIVDPLHCILYSIKCIVRIITIEKTSATLSKLSTLSSMHTLDNEYTHSRPTLLYIV